MTSTTGRESRFQAPGGSTGRPPGGAFGAKVAEATDAVPPKAKSKKKLIMIVVGLLVVAGIGYKFLAPKPPYVASGGDIVALDAQTLNLASGHYLKVGVSVQLLKAKATAANFDTAEASELVIEEFSNRAIDTLATNDARKKLTAELLKGLKKVYPEKVWDVFVTQFVTQ